MEFGKSRLCFLFQRKPVQVALPRDTGRREERRKRREDGTWGDCHQGHLRQNWLLTRCHTCAPHTCSSIHTSRPTCVHTHVHTKGTYMYTDTHITHMFMCTHAYTRCAHKHTCACADAQTYTHECTHTSFIIVNM